MKEPKWTWRKSSRSAGNGACIEVARSGEVVGVRDSKDRSNGHLLVTSTAFDALVTALAAGNGTK